MSTQVLSTNIAETFAPMSARRLLVFGGIALIVGGMFFGDIFAVFVLHQNGGQTGQALLAAAEAARPGSSGSQSKVSSESENCWKIAAPKLTPTST